MSLHAAAPLFVLSTLAGGAATGCAASSIPDPRAAAIVYAGAAARSDSDVLYQMLTTASKRTLGLPRVRAMVADERLELAEQALALRDEDLRVEAVATMRFADGEEASLDFRNGRYGVTSAGVLPGGGRTPQEALQQLRRMLARRSYDGLLRVLSAGTRAAIESDVRDLVEGLNQPAELPVKLVGEEARVPIRGGHMVTLKREAGVWRVQNFD